MTHATLDHNSVCLETLAIWLLEICLFETLCSTLRICQKTFLGYIMSYVLWLELVTISRPKFIAILPTIMLDTSILYVNHGTYNHYVYNSRKLLMRVHIIHNLFKVASNFKNDPHHTVAKESDNIANNHKNITLSTSTFPWPSPMWHFLFVFASYMERW